MNVLQEIFRDNYEIIQYTLHPRDVVIESIDKMINCGDPSFGGAMYGCTHCGNLKFVPFRCHSKFCPSCGAKYCNDRATAMSFKLIKCHHRHCVFTIDEELRHFFLEDRSLLNCLFSAVRSVVLNMFYKAFQTALLNELEKQIGPSFKKVKAAIYKKDKNGFYVYAKPTLTDPSTVSQYISRYLGRPVIGLSRIDSYDGESVTFHYNRHEDNVYVEKTLPAIDFIKLLIQHIPEKHFKMTRYYGLYARNRELDKSLNRLIPKTKHKIILDSNTWRNRIALSFGYDPIQCPNCKKKMELLDLYYKHTKVSLDELYERTMAKMKCHAGGKAA